MPSPLRGRALTLLLLLGCVWGTAFVFIALGLEKFSPMLLAALRFDLASLCLIPIVLWRRQPLWPRTRNQWLAVLVASVLAVGFYNVLLLTGQQHTTASVAAVIVGLNPLLTLVLARATLPDEHVGLGGLAGLGIGLLGVVLLATLKPGPLFDAAGLGELAIGTAILCWALGSVAIRLSRHGLPLLSFVTLQCIFGAILIHIAAAWIEPHPKAIWDAQGLLAVAYLGVAAVAIGYLLYFRILEEVGAIRVNLVSYLAPVFATLGGVLVLHQPFELRALLGFALIASGFVLVARPPSPTPSGVPSAK